MSISSLAKLAAGRCWAGYEPVPGKAPYSNDSCRPAGSKKKKKTEKKAANPAMRDESGMNLKKPATQPKPAPYGSANFNADAIKMMERVRQARSKQASDIQILAKLAADPPCSCACGDTVSTCKCGPDCKCRKEGGSCYKGEKTASLLPLALAAGAVGSYPYARGAVSAMQGPKGYGVQEGVHGYLRGIGELGGGVAGAGLGGALGPVIASKLGGGGKSQAAAALLGALSGAGLGGYGGNRLIRKLTGKSPSEKEKDDKQEKQAGKRGLWDNIHAKRKRGDKPAKPGEKDYPDSKSWTKTVKSSSEIQQLAKLAASPAWQRSEGKNSEGGLNAKGRASYNASTGGNLKAPVTSENPKGKAAARKTSFCARMGGMKSKLTGEKTKNDPDSRINKALRKWNC